MKEEKFLNVLVWDKEKTIDKLKRIENVKR